MKRVQLEVLKDHGSRVSETRVKEEVLKDHGSHVCEKGSVGGSEGSRKSCV